MLFSSALIFISYEFILFDVLLLLRFFLPTVAFVRGDVTGQRGRRRRACNQAASRACASMLQVARVVCLLRCSALLLDRSSLRSLLLRRASSRGWRDEQERRSSAASSSSSAFPLSLVGAEARMRAPLGRAAVLAALLTLSTCLTGEADRGGGGRLGRLGAQQLSPVGRTGPVGSS